MWDGTTLHKRQAALQRLQHDRLQPLSSSTGATEEELQAYYDNAIKKLEQFNDVRRSRRRKLELRCSRQV